MAVKPQQSGLKETLLSSKGRESILPDQKGMANELDNHFRPRARIKRRRKLRGSPPVPALQSHGVGTSPLKGSKPLGDGPREPFPKEAKPKEAGKGGYKHTWTPSQAAKVAGMQKQALTAHDCTTAAKELSHRRPQRAGTQLCNIINPSRRARESLPLRGHDQRGKPK